MVKISFSRQDEFTSWLSCMLAMQSDWVWPYYILPKVTGFMYV